MAVKFRNPVSLPNSLTKELDAYLEEDEEIIDAIRETFVIAIDFRWLILTNMRVIIAVVKFMSVEFRDVRFEGIDMQLTKGVLFDDFHLKSMTDDYHAQFYALTRNRTEEFLQNLENERDYSQKEKKKIEKMIEQEAMEELGSKGPLDEPRVRADILVDTDHNMNVLDRRMEGKRSPAEEEKVVEASTVNPEALQDFGENEPITEEEHVPKMHSEAPAKDLSCNSVTTIRDLKRLLDEGIITQEEFEIKKNEILKRI